MTFYVAEPFAGTDNSIRLDGGDQYFVPERVSIYVSFEGLIALNGNNTIMIEGTLTGSTGIQIGRLPEEGVELDARGASTITISDTGVLTGRTVDAIDLWNINTTIVNYGVILGAYNGINATLLAANTTINNFGRILAANTPVNSFLAIALNNYGTITGYNVLLGIGNFSFNGSNAADKVVNRGTMNGIVALNGGADHYDGGGGRVAGSVNGGAGGDIIRGGAFSDVFNGDGNNDMIEGRGGRDRLAGGDGDDTFDYNAIFHSGPTATTRDLIVDFNRFGNDRIDLSTIDANTGVAGNQAFSLVAKGTAASPVGTGKIGWYWIDNANNALDRTIIRINNDADAAIEMQIELVGLKSLNGAPGVDFIF